MHRSALAAIHTVSSAGFVVSTSSDGTTKLWKKQAHGIELVKQFRAPTQPFGRSALSVDGLLYAASCSTDNTIKVFDVVNFDLFSILNLDFKPNAICWVHRKGELTPLLAVAVHDSAAINIYDLKTDTSDPYVSITHLHAAPIIIITFNPKYNCCVSVDETGVVEYWEPVEGAPKPKTVFKSKGLTDLYEFRKSKSLPTCLTMSPNNESFATVSFPDRQIRLFDMPSGKLSRKYDESLAIAEEQHQSGTAVTQMNDIEFGRRLAIEREVESSKDIGWSNVIFDESGLFLLYSTLFGIKVINTYSSACVKTYAHDERLRLIHLALYQGAPNKLKSTTLAMAASENPLLAEATQRDPILFATAFKNQRFFMYGSVDLAQSQTERDVYNEAPEKVQKSAKEVARTHLPTEATLFTSAGDIVLELYPQHAPKAVENFTTHGKQGYYDGTIFHRVIPKFMVQGGDPKGDGTGGTSIWGREFADEFAAELRHKEPYVVSMANAGPGTNGSQFFITTDAATHLDGKHTIFGRVKQGMDVVHTIEMAKTDRLDRPIEPVSIHSVSC
jgi:peptidylprolyl isomerase domain and WD repeat-containing protein 1